MNRSELAASFPETISLPPEIAELCDWQDEQGAEAVLGGYFELRENDDETFSCWFGSDSPINELAQFGAGGDGSLFCIWRKPDGTRPIVHLGSEGDELYVLAVCAVDFLRLLAIGYSDIGSADFDLPSSDEGSPDNINPEFQRWVRDEFDVAIPETGSEIVLPDDQRHQEFRHWVANQTS